MPLFHTFTRRIRHLFRRRDFEAEMAEEMRFHLEQRAADFAADGLAETEARYAAQRKFGNTGSLQEQAREGRGWGWLERLLADLGFGVRQLIKSPGFTLVAVATLALGIGANTSMFSALDSILLKPLRYPQSEQLVRVDRVTPQNPEGRFSPADFLDLQRGASEAGEFACYSIGDMNLAERGQPAETVASIHVTANFLALLRVQPQLGRDFRPGENVPGKEHILIISQRCWQNRFGGRADIIGRTVRVDGEPHQIVGVLPASFNDWRHLGWVDFVRPISWSSDLSADRRSVVLRVLGRRAETRTAAETAAAIAGLGVRVAADHPEVNAGSAWHAISLNGTVAAANGAYVMPMLIGLSGFVLLIACSNLANLLLARTMARARELAVRTALGASRLQLLRPLLTESLLLALAGGGCALVVADWINQYLAVRSTADNGERVAFELDWRVLAWTMGASLVTAVAFGLAPALFAARLDVNDTLKSGGRGMTGGRGHQLFRSGLIVGQFALAMVLLAGAALFIRGLNELSNRRAGWESSHLVTGTYALKMAGYPDEEHIAAFQRLALQRIEALPGVASASVSTLTPFFNWPDVRKYVVEGRDPPKAGQEPASAVNNVSPHYFETVGTRLLAGRTFTERDNATAPKVFAINQAMAAGLFGRENPIGRRIAWVGGAKLEWGEIVGVVADVKSVLPDPVAVTYQLYQPMAQEPRARNELIVRTDGVAPTAVIDGIRKVMTALDADLPVRQLQPADAKIDRANYELRVLRDMLAGMGVLGLALAALGVYGVIARMMAQRTSEFAIRLALGASVKHVTRLVLGSGVKLALIGSGLGLIGTLGVSALIAASFPNMHFNNALVLMVAMLVLVGVAVLACWLPARRAGRVDPMVALRSE